MNLPNKLTLVRMLLIPLFVVLLLLAEVDKEKINGIQWDYKAGYIWAAIFVFFAAAITDLLDGHIALRLRQVTVLGKFMDPVADKLLTVTAFIMLVRFRVVPATMVVIIVLREFLVQGMRLAAISRGKVVAASFLARYKTVSHYIAIITAMVQWIASIKHGGFPPGGPALHPVHFTQVSNYVMGVTTFLTVYTGVEYFLRNRHLFTDTPAPESPSA